MKKEITKLTKLEKEKIENRLLAVFATALGSIMLLLYVMNWLQGSSGFILTARILVYTLLVGFIAGTIFLSIKSKQFLKKNQQERSLKYKNWKNVTLAGAIVTFIVYPTEIIFGFFRLIRLGNVGNTIVSSFINKFNFLTGNPIATRILCMIILIAIYTIAVFVYYGMLTRKAHKSSLNKGAKKAG